MTNKRQRTHLKGRKYKPGMRLGPKNILFIADSEEYHKRREGIFVCPFCQKHFQTRVDHIASGNTVSCGCYLGNRFKTEDISGKKFGKLTVLEPTSYRTKDSRVLWKCICDCGNIHYATSDHLNNGDVTSCGCICSKGEEKVKEILQSLNIFYHEQKTFEDCINPMTGTKLSFDFYLPNYNTCIEYDGKQHFEITGGYYNEHSFEELQNRDNIKNQYCENNNIKLIRVPYWNYDNLNETYLIERIKNDKLL